MLDTVHILGMPSEDTMKRLIQAGLDLNFYPAQFLEQAAEAATEGPGNPPLVLGIPDVPHPLLSWSDVAPEQAHLAAAGAVPSTDAIMAAVVQYNRRQLMAAQQQPAASAAAAGADTNNLQQQQQQQQQPLLVVGYVMKASREDALSKAGMLHLLPQEGMCFMPLDLDTLTQQQQQQQHQQGDQQHLQSGRQALPLQQPQQELVHIDILLHKGSDELVRLTEASDTNTDSTAAAASATSDAAAAACPAAAVGVTWSPRLLGLQAWLAAHPDVCVVDPFENTAKVLDRLLLARLLRGLQGLELPAGVMARGPAFCEVQGFDAGTADAVAAAGVRPPFIVKPRVACGVAQSHAMALVLSLVGLQQLQGRLPAPALVQEFVNHGGQQYKVYVLGEQVFVTPRASIPDLHLSEGQQQQQCLLFDSLASLPTQLPPELTQQQHQEQQEQQPSVPPEEALRVLAAYLRQHLGLTLFGFDVVVAAPSSSSSSSSTSQEQQQQQELVVIDVNYFPNYRGGKEVPALFRAALRQAWERHQQQLQL